MAADRTYHPHIWDNICVYMLGCKYGVAVFEEIEVRSFNPNIAIELGFMTALGRRCLPLKEKRMPALPVDVGSLIYKEFDAYDMGETVTRAVQDWVQCDLRLSAVSEERLLGVWKSEWGMGGEVTNTGTAEITGVSGELNIVLRDDRASCYTAKIDVLSEDELSATWVNVDYPDDFGRWKARITADVRQISGEWTSKATTATGTWTLIRES